VEVIVEALGAVLSEPSSYLFAAVLGGLSIVTVATLTRFTAFERNRIWILAGLSPLLGLHTFFFVALYPHGTGLTRIAPFAWVESIFLLVVCCTASDLALRVRNARKEMDPDIFE